MIRRAELDRYRLMSNTDRQLKRYEVGGYLYSAGELFDLVVKRQPLMVPEDFALLYVVLNSEEA